jgi:hypothetical protein
MTHRLILLLLFIGFLACKKKEIEAIPVSTPAEVNRNFFFNAYDESDNQLNNINGNTFIINFYQNNNVVYSYKTKNAGSNSSFNINNFKDGGYVCEIRDSLNLFGYNKDSIIVKNNAYYIGGSCCVSSTTSGKIGGVRQIPTFSISNYSIVSDTSQSGGSGIYFKINVVNINNSGAIAIYYYKNNQVSSNPLYNYSILFPNNYLVSNNHPYTSDIILDASLESTTAVHSGDSIYFAIYPAALHFTSNASYDHLAPIDALGWGQYTALSSQRIIIPYKVH